MSSEIANVLAGGHVPAALANKGAGDELGKGILSSFGIIGFKGKVWSIKYQGNEMQLMREDGDGPRASIEVVLVKASPHISKIFYEGGYVDGSNSPPDCWSTNGVAPDPASSKKQSNTCAGCKNNVWGSKVTEAGKQTKACTDSKRVAVVPLGDLKNELYGGPMLLRVPAASLKDIKSYGDLTQSYGYPYYAVATRLGFDHTEAFPKFVFSAIRGLNDAEGKIIAELQDDPRVKRMLEDGVEIATHEPATPAVPASPFEQPTPVGPLVTQQVTTAPVVAPAPQPVTPTPAAVPQTEPQQSAGGFGGATQAPKRTRRTKEQIAADNAAAAAAAGGAQTKPTVQTGSGFGAVAPVQEATPVQQTAQPAASTPNAAEAAPEDFEAQLDALLNT